MSPDIPQNCSACGAHLNEGTKPLEIGYQVRGVYDGILLWLCPNCGHARPRFSDGGRLTEAARRYCDAINLSQQMRGV
jgi:hypothetical protein